MTPAQAELFADGDLIDTEQGPLFDVEHVRPPRPTAETMTGAAVMEYLSIGRRDLTTARNRRQIRQVSPGVYLTASVTKHLAGRQVATLGQTLAILDRSAGWFRTNGGRLGLTTDPVGSCYRYSRSSVNAAAVKLRRVDAERETRRAERELDRLAAEATLPASEQRRLATQREAEARRADAKANR
jgi:hypothetical protein